MKTISLALRNLTRQKKRSFLLAGAVAFGFFIVTLIDGLATGSLQNFSEQFAYMFGGNVMIQGVERDVNNKEMTVCRDADFLDDVIKQSGLNYTYMNRRSIAYGTMIFEGSKSMRNIFGCDFDKEIFLKDSMQIVSGSWEAALAKDSIMLSESTAKSLQINAGEQLLIQMETITGQQTVGEFTLGAITKDISLLGSIAAYAHIEYINELMGLKPDEFYICTLMLEDHKQQDQAANQLETLIRDAGKPVTNRMAAIQANPTNVINGINKQVEDATWEGTMFAVLSLNDNIPQLQQILNVVQMVSLGILAALFLITMIGISNTFKMIIYERVGEIGTMRALGMKQKEAGRIFIWEAVLLSFFGALVGFIVAFIAMNILGLFTVNNPELSLFLHNGHWTYILSFGSFFLKFALVIILTIIAVLSSAKTVAKMNPADAFRTVK